MISANPPRSLALGRSPSSSIAPATPTTGISTRDNAESFLAHVGRELAREALPGSATEGLDSKLLIRSAGIWHRVQLGPWASAEAARAVAEILQRVAGTPPVVISR